VIAEGRKSVALLFAMSVAAAANAMMDRPTA
jgi:hypothetical protein